MELTALDMLKSKFLWQEGQPLRLHLGCGGTYFPGYINIDFPPEEHTTLADYSPDLFTDITMLDFPVASVDEVRLHHLFEHFSRPVALGLLVLWSKWLKPRGLLHIETPDVLGCAKALLSTDLNFSQKQAMLRHVFGSHEATWAYHLDGWYEEKFRHVLTAFGYSTKIKLWQWDMPPYLHNVEVIAVKQRSIATADLIKVGCDILKESMVNDAPSEQRMAEVWKESMIAFLDKSRGETPLNAYIPPNRAPETKTTLQAAMQSLRNRIRGSKRPR